MLQLGATVRFGRVLVELGVTVQQGRALMKQLGVEQQLRVAGEQCRRSPDSSALWGNTWLFFFFE
jgi:hypothetical protein